MRVGVSVCHPGMGHPGVSAPLCVSTCLPHSTPSIPPFPAQLNAFLVHAAEQYVNPNFTAALESQVRPKPPLPDV